MPSTNAPAYMYVCMRRTLVYSSGSHTVGEGGVGGVGWDGISAGEVSKEPKQPITGQVLCVSALTA